MNRWCCPTYEKYLSSLETRSCARCGRSLDRHMSFHPHVCVSSGVVSCIGFMNYSGENREEVLADLVAIEQTWR